MELWVQNHTFVHIWSRSDMRTHEHITLKYNAFNPLVEGGTQMKLTPKYIFTKTYELMDMLNIV